MAQTDAFCARTLPALWRYNLSVMDLEQEERLLPVGEEMFDAMAVDHGMLGIAYAWHKIEGELPAEFHQWIKKNFRLESHLPGMMNGASGMAWVLFDLGHEKLAVKALQFAAEHRQLFTEMSLAYGLAGYGMTNLYFWQKTGEDMYWEEALKVADVLCEEAKTQSVGVSWEDPQGTGAGIGLCEGGSGIALFLLYMYCVTQNANYLNTGLAGLRFDISCGRELEGAYGFPRHTVKAASILSPYLAHGSAGVASVALRYYKITQDADLFDFITRIKPAVAQKYTLACGLATGLSGLGDYLLDGYQLLGDNSYLELAYRAADGLKIFAIERENGVSFPMLTHAKICTDFATGSAGVGLFLHRLHTRGTNNNFMLDDILTNFFAAQQETQKLTASNDENALAE